MVCKVGETHRRRVRLTIRFDDSTEPEEATMEVLHSRAQTKAGPETWFKGQVWLDEVLGAADSPGRLQAYNVHFAPGARTAWHQHDGGQAIFVTEGVGRAQSRGGKIQEIRAGDTVVFQPGEWHWHGAAPDRFMVHTAMQEVEQGGETAEWGEHVTDEEYTAEV
jgi:quercetin dioxygenase-like cupin family protein